MLVPGSVIAVAVILVAVMPGSVYTWAFERQASSFGANFADRTLRFIAMSLVFHLVLGWPEYLLYQLAFDSPPFSVAQFAAAWGVGVVLLAVPGATGTVLGGLYATRNTRTGWTWVRARLTERQEHWLLQTSLGRTPAPRAWDDLFSDAPLAYVRIQTVSGEWIAGLFADHSYAGGFPAETDLLLEDAWSTSDDGVLQQSLGYPVYVPAGQIAWLELVPADSVLEEVPDGTTTAG